MDYTETEVLEMFKALANSTRLQIMQWLSDPEEAFRGLREHQDGGISGWGGTCVGTIQKKAGISQSAISTYLKVMTQAGLLESRRDGKWTYYRIHEDAVTALADFVAAWKE